MRKQINSSGDTGPVGEKKARIPNLALAVSPIVVMLVVIIGGVTVLDIRVEVLLMIAAAYAALLSIWLGHSWKEIEDALVTQFSKAFPAILIVLCVGVVIGSWVASGTIPLLVYFGVEAISPKFIIVTAFLVTLILSVATGTSWGSVGTVGAAFIGVATAMGAPLPAVAGALVSGAYFGDKMSPLSDSTNLSAVAAGVNLYKHIQHLLWTTGPGAIVCVIVYTIAGFWYSDRAPAEVHTMDKFLHQLQELFHMSMPFGLLLLIPVVIIVVGSLMRMPTVPVMLASAASASLLAVFGQGFSLKDTALSMMSGFTMDMFSTSQNSSVDVGSLSEAIPTLLERGGMESMTTIFLVVVCAFAFVAALTVSGSLDVVMSALMKVVHSNGQLIAVTVAGGVLLIAATGTSTVSFLILGGMLRHEYIRRGLEARNLGRTMEDAVTVVEPILPWTLAGVFMASALGVPTLEYAPWAVLCYSGVFFALLWGFTGFAVSKITKKSDDYEEYQEIKEKVARENAAT
ncbi:Na+/H+ antiporter NhaC [Brevibacterium sp. CSND-B09]|uniref:Na+/H+ antiporter NhaC n=1 Tax=Brevibacterium sp. CSND-B09 TaxID=3462571 RepID=UPI00406A4903